MNNKPLTSEKDEVSIFAYVGKTYFCLAKDITRISNMKEMISLRKWLFYLSILCVFSSIGCSNKSKEKPPATNPPPSSNIQQKQISGEISPLSKKDKKVIKRGKGSPKKAAEVRNNEGEVTNVSADEIIATGEKYKATPYKFGSKSGQTSTFDCSSFTQHVYGENGKKIPRDSRQQSETGVEVSKEHMQKADLLFFKRSPDSTDERVTHVAIYKGDDQILHTFGKGGVTDSKLSGTNWERRLVKVRRILQDSTGL